jgi:hypothetical protein
MKTAKPSRKVFAVGLTAALVMGLSSASITAAFGATPNTLDLRVLLIGDGATDVTTVAWESALTTEGVPYTEIDATGTSPSQTVTLPALSSGTTGFFNGVVVADSPTNFAAGALSALDTYESTFGVDQVDGYMYPDPNLGATDASGGALPDPDTGTLTPAGLAAFPGLAGPIPFASGTYGYGATITAGAPYTTLLTNAAGQAMAGIYQHPSTDPQAGVAELSLYFDYNYAQLQWLLLAPGLINWVTQGTHLGLDRNYVEVDIDDTFTPDNAWSTAVHDNDYSDADSQRMDPTDVVTAADWSNPTQEKDPSARPASEPSTTFRMDQLFNYGGTIEYQNGELDLPGEPTCGTTLDAAGTCGPDPLLAEFQATDPATGKPYSADFGWLSHTYDTPYLDIGCATQDYIEAELNENTSDSTAAAGTTPGTGGLGLAVSNIPAGSTDVPNAYGTYNPQVFVPGNHSGFADLAPGTPATVDPPDLDEADASTTGGSLASGTYEYAVTDQFNGADSTTIDQSQAYVTDGLQGDIAPVAVTGPAGSVSLVGQAICHAANYIIYRSAAPYTSWTEIGTYATPGSATLPDSSSGDTSPAQGNTVCSGGTSPDPTSCAGEQELTFTDTGAKSGTTSAGVTYMDTPMPAGWTPPIVENANELPWEQNPYFTPALQAAGITTVGADASKAYPDPADDQFGIGATYSGPTYAAGQAFVEDGTGSYSYQVAPRHPINVFYNVATNAQELDEYNTLYSSAAPDSQCHDTTVTTCSATLFTFADVINQVVTGMLQNMLSNNPEVSYVHQTNLMGTPPYSGILPPANYAPAATAQPGTDGDGTLYEVLNPLISEYDSYFNSTTPYVQLTLGGIGNVLADQTAWAGALAPATPTVSASDTNGVVTIANAGTGAINVPVTVPPGSTVSGTSSLQPYGGVLSNWLSVAGTSSQTLTENSAPVITSAASATANVGTAFSFTVGTTGAPAPAISETGALPAGLSWTDNGNGTATIAGTATSGSGGVYPLAITASSSAGSVVQSFTLTATEAPSVTSPATATFTTTVAGTYAITTTGYPAPTLTYTATTLTGTATTLPTGLSFTDNGNGTGAISGTPAAGSQGTYNVALSATNASGSTATLPVTLTVDEAAAPAITSGTTAYFTLDAAGSFAIATTGAPTPALTETGALPAGLTYTDNLNGTATITGTPTATGTTDLTIGASNGIGSAASQTLALIVGQAPAFTSAASAGANVGAPFSFTVTTSGYPAPSMGETGLPADFSFVNNGDGTATISGNPSETDVGSYTVNLTAANGTGSAGQVFTLSVGEAPSFSSPSSATATVGTLFTFAVTDAGDPVPSFSETGALPSGVTFVDNGNGTAGFTGTPAAGTGGTYALTLTATNSVGSTSQAFTLTVDEAPSITSASTATFSAKSAGSFSISARGYPAPALTETGALPSGVSFTATTAGAATVAGTPAAGTQGTYPVTITATGTSTATQSFTLVVNSGLAITSASTATATAGTSFSFSVTTTGAPTPALTHTGTLPSGITFAAGTNGTATLAGTPAATDSGTYSLTFTAKNSTGTASQAFTLTIDQLPSFSTAVSATETAGTAFSFLVSAKGYPAPVLALTGGALPGGVTFAPGSAGTATLAGTTAVVAGTYPLTFTATSGASTATQTFTLTVKAAGTKVPVPSFTSAASATATAGTAFTFSVTTTGSPDTTYTTSVTHSGTMPAGVSFANNGNGTATISGTPTAASGGTYTITLTASNSAGKTTQSFVLTVDAGPTIATAATATATVGSAFNFTVKATGAPAPAMTESGTLPAGLTWTDNANGTATLSGTVGTGQGAVYKLTLGAKNTFGSTTQAFTLTVDQAPAITSASSGSATHGQAFSFSFTSIGYPLPTVTHTGTVRGLTYTRNTNGTATLSGAPTTAGTYSLTITATNSVGSATQPFTLKVA